MNHMESDGWWLDELYKFCGVTFYSDCFNALPTYEDVEVDKYGVGTGCCTKCNQLSKFHDEKENKYY